MFHQLLYFLISYRRSLAEEDSNKFNKRFGFLDFIKKVKFCTVHHIFIITIIFYRKIVRGRNPPRIPPRFQRSQKEARPRRKTWSVKDAKNVNKNHLPKERDNSVLVYVLPQDQNLHVTQLRRLIAAKKIKERKVGKSWGNVKNVWRTSQTHQKLQ